MLLEAEQALQTYRALSQRLAHWQGQVELLDKQIVEQQTKLDDAELQVQYHGEALKILQALEEKWRGSFEQALAGVVSHGLTTVFGRELRVNIESEVKRSVASMTMTVTEGENTTGILGAEGGSLVEVMDFLLRVLLTLSSRPPLRHLLILDEPFSHVSAEYRAALCDLLRELAAQLDFQILLVSHEPEMADAADIAYLITKPEDQAVIQSLKTAMEVP